MGDHAARMEGIYTKYYSLKLYGSCYMEAQMGG